MDSVENLDTSLIEGLFTTQSVATLPILVILVVLYSVMRVWSSKKGKVEARKQDLVEKTTTDLQTENKAQNDLRNQADDFFGR